jgi:glycosyltransferase involved in cell wall biosynthesis
MPTITLAVIAKDELKDLQRIITEYGKYFEQVDLAIDDQGVIDELSKDKPNNVNLYKYEWVNDFAHKRNWLAEKCKADFYFTIDSDDTIVSPEKIRDVAKDAESSRYNIVYGYYIYGVDQDGNCCAAHWKERLIKNDPNLRWNKKIHENIVPISMVGHNFNLDERLLVNHNITFEDTVESQKRNLKFLLEEYQQDGDKTDPRTIAYLGRVLFGLGDFKRARYFLEKHIQLSGWDEDRHLSWCQLADLHRLEKNYDQAIACGFEALAERPDFPDGYLALFWVYFDQEKWTKAIEWADLGLKKEPPKNFIVTDPSSYTWRPALALSYAYLNIGEHDKAMRLFRFAQKLAPSVQFVKDNEKLYEEAVDRKNYIDNFIWLLNYTEKNNGIVRDLVRSIPPSFYENETIAKLRNFYLEPKYWSDKSVVIYCGNTPHSWSPKDVSTGIGGSEEAVINLAKELDNLGYEVTVYNSCSEEGVYGGVEYLNSVRFNPKDQFNIIIGWRCNVFAYQIQGKRKIVWVHDLPGGLGLTEENCRFFDKIVVLSEYHKTLLPSFVPEEKVYISTNGINPSDFLGLEDIKREPHRVIYTSSYDRGIELILENWSEIRKAVPDAELHCYYGWDTYLNYVNKGLIKDDGFYERMQKLFSQEGVVEHGRVGHKELAEEYAKASIYAYPCTYTGEINCIALTKAIACGCYPLTNDFAVLPERNTHGKVVKNERFISALVTLLRKGDTQIDNKGYVEANSWSKVAEDWHNNLFPNEIEVVLGDRANWTWDLIENKKAKIVDIGCNKGHMFDGWDRTNITSVDIDLYDLPNFVRANAEELPFEDNSFDYACLLEIVEHTKNPIKVLSEARRVAKKTIITVPYEYEWAEEMEPFWSLEKKKAKKDFEIELKNANKALEITDDGYAHLFHETFYTPELLRDHLTQAGFNEFRIVKIRFGKWIWLGAICQK